MGATHSQGVFQISAIYFLEVQIRQSGIQFSRCKNWLWNVSELDTLSDLCDFRQFQLIQHPPEGGIFRDNGSNQGGVPLVIG